MSARAKIIIYTLLLQGIYGPLVRAQEKQASVTATGKKSTDQGLSQIIEAKARALIERHISPESFQLFVTAIPKAKTSVESSYVPQEATTGSLAELAEKVEIEVLLANRYGKPTRTKLRDILLRKLELDLARGDQISFSSLGIEISPSKSELELALTRVEADARDTKGRLEVLTRERDDAKRDLSLAKQDLDNAAREKLATPPSAAKPDTPTPEAPAKDASSPFADTLSYVLVGATFLLVFGLVLFAFMFKSGMSAIGSALQSISSNLPVLGQRISEGSASRTIEAEATPTKESPGSKELPHAATSTAGISLESVYARILKINEELLESWSERSEAVMLRHLSILLARPEGLAKAVISMEILGRDRANELYQKLGSEQQTRVWEFLQTGEYSRPKRELMLEVGEELKTKILGQGFANQRGKVSDTLSAKLLKLNFDDLLKLAIEVNDEQLARLFLHVQADVLNQILTQLFANDREQFHRASQAIGRIPQAAQAVQLDAAIIQTLDQVLEGAKADSYRPYLSYYRTLLESADEAIVDTLAETLTAQSDALGRYIQSTIVTFNTFFKLQKSYQDEIVASMTNRDVAAIMAGLADDLKALVLNLVDTQRRDLVIEESERLSGRGARQVEAMHKSAKILVVKNILDLRTHASLDALLLKNGDINANSSDKQAA